MKKHHEVENIVFTDDEIVIIVDGATRRFSMAQLSPKLANASAIERKSYEVSPSGYGIHWPLLDEDLSIDGMLGINHAPPQFSQKQAA